MFLNVHFALIPGVRADTCAASPNQDRSGAPSLETSGWNGRIDRVAHWNQHKKVKLMGKGRSEMLNQMARKMTSVGQEVYSTSSSCVICNLCNSSLPFSCLYVRSSSIQICTVSKSSIWVSKRNRTYDVYSRNQFFPVTLQSWRNREKCWSCFVASSLRSKRYQKQGHAATTQTMFKFEISPTNCYIEEVRNVSETLRSTRRTRVWP